MIGTTSSCIWALVIIRTPDAVLLKSIIDTDIVSVKRHLIHFIDKFIFFVDFVAIFVRIVAILSKNKKRRKD